MGQTRRHPRHDYDDHAGRQAPPRRRPLTLTDAAKAAGVDAGALKSFCRHGWLGVNGVQFPLIELLGDGPVDSAPQGWSRPADIETILTWCEAIASAPLRKIQPRATAQELAQ